STRRTGRTRSTRSWPAFCARRSVENIDVVWKQEFRIDAAYEVENSTAIYSGLLRFADLTILAPNTIYPMFIVAQSARKGQVRDQLRRPPFRQLKIARALGG